MAKVEGTFERPSIRLTYDFFLWCMIFVLIITLIILFTNNFNWLSLMALAVIVMIIVLIANKNHLNKVVFELTKNNVSAYSGSDLVKQVYGEIRYKIIIGTERNNISGFNRYRTGLDSRAVVYDTRYVRRLVIKSIDTKDVLTISEPLDGKSSHEKDSSEFMSDFLTNEPGVIDEIVEQLNFLHIRKLL